MINEKTVLLVPFVVYRFIISICYVLYVSSHTYMHLVRFGMSLGYAILVFYALREKVIPTFIMAGSIFLTGLTVVGFEAATILQIGPIVSEVLGILLGVYFIYVGIRVLYLQVKLCVQARRALLKES
jgi:hypothetical protein